MGKKKHDLKQLAMQSMRDHGFEPVFSQEALAQLGKMTHPATCLSKCEDLRSLLWCSIDNDDSKDLDQLTFAEKDKEGKMTLWIAIADVDALVIKDSPIDRHAQINTTSVYTPDKVFSMLPEKLSTDLTSLNENQDRMALVSKIEIDQQGDVEAVSIFDAMVRNAAKLTYRSVGAWLEKESGVPEKIKQVPGLEQALLCQHEAAQILKAKRHALGALTLESSDVEAKVTENQEVILRLPSHNFADQLIEHFMIAANFAMATCLRDWGMPSLRRVVREPERWDRIMAIAASFGERLPAQPDSKALESFLVKRKKKDPEAFPDLSLSVIKLLGRGEYIVETLGDKPVGHFALAISEYAHSTAPNRRFPDLIVQRQFKAHLKGKKSPYSLEDLQILAEHCTTQENQANKVERHMNKVAAAMLLSKKIGASFKGIVTGASEKGTWARIFSPPIEGKIIHGSEKLDVGDRVVLQLVSVDIPKGYINFTVHHS